MVQRPQCVRGELRLEILTDYPERLATLKAVYVGDDYRRYGGKRMSDCIRTSPSYGWWGLMSGTLRMSSVGKLHVALEDAVPLEENEVYAPGRGSARGDRGGYGPR